MRTLKAMHEEYLLKLREIDFNSTNRITDSNGIDDDKYQVFAIQEEDLLIEGISEAHIIFIML